ncbi:DgyrCDS3839 [Dimorphilus gyrociliatus]|uniref:DgyrCDS3839 n=1 Tax=Dimorphilus gyrociliatus TaxID=2664684 RepID=A0A7I8VF31_9ANNE|nr:DgyrCDS3839 [Dimorphilus gyrociliatus]
MESEELNIKISLSTFGDHIICPVCMNILQDVHITTCGHKFCGKCIIEAIDRRQKCPCCNGSLNPDSVIRDLSFNELIISIQEAKKNEEAAYLDNIISEAGQLGSEVKDSQNLIKEVLKKHLRQGLAAHEKYCQLIIDECERRKRSLSTETEEERETQVNRYEFEKSESIRLISEAYDRYLSEHIPHITVLPITVTFILLHKNISIQDITIKPNSTINDFTRILHQEMEKLHDPIIEVSDTAKFFSLSPFSDSNFKNIEDQINLVINEKKKVAGLHVIPAGIKPVLQYGLKPGTKIVLYGEVKLLSDKPKVCFSQTFDKEFPESMDYFTCQQCNFHCHQIGMYIQNHVPTCDVEDHVESLSEFSVDLIVEGVAKCLEIILGKDDLPKKLPPNMATKFRIGTQLVEEIKGIGYKGEIGYQTLLYSNDTEIRKVFMFLVERLPKESSTTSDRKLSAYEQLQHTIGREIREQLELPWIPSFLKKRGTDVKPIASQLKDVRNLPASLMELNSSLLVEQQEKELSLSKSIRTKHQKSQDALGNIVKKSILEAKSKSMQNGDWMNYRSINISNTTTLFHSNEENVNDDSPKSAEQLEEGKEVKSSISKEEELDNLRSELLDISKQMEKLELKCSKYNGVLPKLKKKSNRLDDDNRKREEEYNIKKKIIDLLPNASDNTILLEKKVKTTQEKIDEFEKEWELRRKPLEERLAKLQETADKTTSLTEKKIEELKKVKQDFKDVTSEYKIKEEAQKQLVLIDTKEVQKEVNSIGGKLDRTFTVTDELLFRDAKKDETSRKSYKHLAALHENCKIIIKTLEETGAIIREIRTLEDQIESKSQEKIEENLEKIAKDYAEMKKENTELKQRLAKK